MNLKQAFKIAQADVFVRPEWEDAKAVILAAGLCPSCACDGQKNKLTVWKPANEGQRAGQECSVCDEFFLTGDQGNPEWQK